MKLLELFSGTGSVGKVARELGFDVVSLDLKDADVNADILNWNFKVFKQNEFDVIWASPPCTEYSIAKTVAVGIRKIDYANSTVKKTIEIIRYFNPLVWFIENPQTGLLKRQEFMQDFHYFDLDYCKYGFAYRKRTRIWTGGYDQQGNILPREASILTSWKPRPLCKKDCGNVINNKHRETAQRMPSGKKSDWGNDYIIHRQDELYRIPSEFVNELFSSILSNLLHQQRWVKKNNWRCSNQRHYHKNWPV